MLNAMENASSVEIKKGFVIAEHSPEKRSKLKNILIASMSNNDIDSRIFALSWIETRMRTNTRNGDQGKACGIFQIHARYSYPMFRRKYGFNASLSSFKDFNKIKYIEYIFDNIKYLKDFIYKDKLFSLIKKSNFNDMSDAENKFYFRLLSSTVFLVQNS